MRACGSQERPLRKVYYSSSSRLPRKGKEEVDKKCVCVVSSHLTWTSALWMNQPGSHRRKVTQNFSAFLLRCLRLNFSRENDSAVPFSLSSTVKSNFVY